MKYVLYFLTVFKNIQKYFHCASQLRKIFASLAHVHVHVHNERNFPPAKLDSTIDASFLCNEHGNLYFYRIIIVYI